MRKPSLLNLSIVTTESEPSDCISEQSPSNKNATVIEMAQVSKTPKQPPSPRSRTLEISNKLPKAADTRSCALEGASDGQHPSSKQNICTDDIYTEEMPPLSVATSTSSALKQLSRKLSSPRGIGKSQVVKPAVSKKRGTRWKSLRHHVIKETNGQNSRTQQSPAQNSKEEEAQEAEPVPNTTIHGDQHINYAICWGKIKVRVLFPYEQWRKWWDLGIAIALLYCCIEIPLETGFAITILPGSFLWNFSVFLDAFFLSDCAINFNTAILKRNGEMITDPRKIRWNYFTGWFAIDFGTSIPISAIVELSVSGMGDLQHTLTTFPKILRIVRVLRLIKLFRMFRFAALMKRWQKANQMQFILSKAMVLLVVVTLCVHILACTFAFTAEASSDGDTGRLDPNSWPARHLDYEYIEDIELSRMYLWAVYWAIITVTTVGYGDVLPLTNLEVIVTIIASGIGVCVFGYVMGSVTSVIAYEDAAQLQLKERVQELVHWMSVHDLPQKLRMRIRRHYTHVWKVRGLVDDAFILNELPSFLRQEVANYMYADHVNAVPFLRDLGHERPGALARLVVAFSLTRAVPTQRIIKEGNFGDEMFIVASGVLEIRKSDAESAEEVEARESMETAVKKSPWRKFSDAVSPRRNSDDDNRNPVIGMIRGHANSPRGIPPKGLAPSSNAQPCEESSPGVTSPREMFASADKAIVFDGYQVGTYFAEYAVIRRDFEPRVPHPFTVQALETSDLFVLGRDDYQAVLRNYPPALRELVQPKVSSKRSERSLLQCADARIRTPQSSECADARIRTESQYWLQHLDDSCPKPAQSNGTTGTEGTTQAPTMRLPEWVRQSSAPPGSPPERITAYDAEIDLAPTSSSNSFDGPRSRAGSKSKVHRPRSRPRPAKRLGRSVSGSPRSHQWQRPPPHPHQTNRSTATLDGVLGMTRRLLHEQNQLGRRQARLEGRLNDVVRLLEKKFTQDAGAAATK